MNKALNKAINKELDQVVKAFESKQNVTLVFKHLAPKVIEDSEHLYKAKYKDSFGSYTFQIQKVGDAWQVTSSGLKFSPTKDKDFLRWNYESQLALYSPKVLN